jgi:hypothetical protein
MNLDPPKSENLEKRGNVANCLGLFAHSHAHLDGLKTKYHFTQPPHAPIAECSFSAP